MKIKLVLLIAVALLIQPAGIRARGLGIDEAYRDEIMKWRQGRENRLRADDGWLTIAGLHWLKDGTTTFGASPDNDIVLPEGSMAARAGTFEFHGGKTRVHVNPGVSLTMNGKPVAEADLKPDSKDILTTGSVSMWVHQSGDRYAIRVRDTNSALRRDFTGCRWFPLDAGYRAEARFVPYDSSRTVQVPNIMGDLETYESPGEVVFSLKGQELRMQAIQTVPTRLWFIFRDQTSGKETYSAARFLYADAPVEGKVVVDFNKAENPPCAFNPFTTCPLPPPQNRLPIRIEAGEMAYHH